MPDVPGRSLPFRKRRRQAVVCAGCRRRKIACDRKAPCAQCVQAQLQCTYYHNYTQSDFQIDNHSSANPKPRSNSSASSTQATHQSHGSGPSESLVNVDYQKTFSISDLGVGSAMPAALSVDLAAPSWLDAEIFNAFSQPLSTPLGANVAFFSPGTTATSLSDPGSEARQSAVPPSSSDPESFPAEPGRVLFSKSRLYGPTYWISLLRKYEQQALFDEVINVLFQGEGHALLQKCKGIARQVKSRGPASRSLSRPLYEFLPPREICDELVRLYLRTFEAVLRVLHVPSFQLSYQQFWSNPQASSEPFVLQLILIMAVGTCFYQDASAAKSAATLHCEATHWIYACHRRLAAPVRKKDLDLRRVQSQCLLVIALLTNTNAVSGDLVGMSVASLVQSAMAVGLHIAPSQLPINSLEAEIRRRLWATILELVVQCSLDSGIHPAVSAESLNCEFPSNLDDSQISESTEALPTGHPASTFTQCSMQRALLRSLPIRLRIAEALSQFQGDALTYEATLRMGAELTAACRETSKLIDSFMSRTSTGHGARPRAFHIKILDLLARRFLLLLHAQFAHKATSDVAYHFSRTVCQECSLLLLSPPSSHDGESTRCPLRRNGIGETDMNSDSDYDNADVELDSDPDTDAAAATTAAAPWSSLQDYANLQLLGSGLFKNTSLAASIIVCAEVLQQQREDSSPVTSSPSLPVRRELLRTLEHTARLTRRRVCAGETSVKAAAFFTCMRAYIQDGARRSPQQRAIIVADTIHDALAECCAILEARLRSPCSSGILYPNTQGPSRVEVEGHMSDSLSLDCSDTWHASPWEDDAGFLH